MTLNFKRYLVEQFIPQWRQDITGAAFVVGQVVRHRNSSHTVLAVRAMPWRNIFDYVLDGVSYLVLESEVEKDNNANSNTVDGWRVVRH